ncbi:unnamed protein product [Thlaspi arvense]|uniref:DC1 domain-containing protein n=1 Tax=Thlaspi arvense TaxID=13288 RepID=A0AAU9SCI0_THLAR|nr:unnamed protein product [Thlaspi arvense]
MSLLWTLQWQAILLLFYLRFYDPFCMCDKVNIPYYIDNKKKHEHTLHYFPRQSTLVCDVCALEGGSEYLYVCLLCDFIVHKRCTDLPYVIKVSCHDHRLAFTPKLPYKEWTTNCGVCHTKIYENYGEYSCRMKGCVYAMHSRCAMQSGVCDGKELEGEPEEETYKNTKMYEEKGDGIIQHLSHLIHLMRLEENFHDDTNNCQACIRLFYDDGNVYRCMKCDFIILHESCAYMPRVKQSMLNVHRLFLSLDYTTRWFECKRCYRYSCGFAYVCPLEVSRLELDIFCASISEPFDYHSHPHPLFISE